MAKSKRNKIRKALSPQSNSSPSLADEHENEELMDDLFAQLDSRDTNIQSESAALITAVETRQEADGAAPRKQDAKSRFAARQARKAAALSATQSPTDAEADARLQREAQAEEEAIKRVCAEHGLQLYQINADGHCLFAAIAHQLALLGILDADLASYPTTRNAAASFIHSHKSDFLPFLPSIEGEDGEGAQLGGVMSDRDFDHYCASIRNTGIWGGEPEILALSRAYNVPIHVVQGGNPPVVVHSPHGHTVASTDSSPVAWISYHRYMYGLGEHYNSLRPKSLKNTMTGMIQSLAHSS